MWIAYLNTAVSLSSSEASCSSILSFSLSGSSKNDPISLHFLSAPERRDVRLSAVKAGPIVKSNDYLCPTLDNVNNIKIAVSTYTYKHTCS